MKIDINIDIHININNHRFKYHMICICLSIYMFPFGSKCLLRKYLGYDLGSSTVCYAGWTNIQAPFSQHKASIYDYQRIYQYGICVSQYFIIQMGLDNIPTFKHISFTSNKSLTNNGIYIFKFKHGNEWDDTDVYIYMYIYIYICNIYF